jgi:hypothetical protein
MTWDPKGLKKFARTVQRNLEADPTLARPSYCWCLDQVKLHLNTAYAAAGLGEGRIGRTKEELMKLILPLAKKAG